jgi:hypothetical protein
MDLKWEVIWAQAIGRGPKCRVINPLSIFIRMIQLELVAGFAPDGGQ